MHIVKPEYNYSPETFKDLLFAVEVMFQVTASRADKNHPRAKDPVDWDQLASMLHEAITRAGGCCDYVQKNDKC